MLQAWWSNRFGHSWPPSEGGTNTARSRVCVPSPHDDEHGVHSPHSPTWQSTAAAVNETTKEARAP